MGGDMVLRIEDTDDARSTSESEAAILDGLRWCGITWDEGPDKGGPYSPYRQSERMKAGLYQESLKRLVDAGKAYRCFLTDEEIVEQRAAAETKGVPFVLDSPWARASEGQSQDMLDRGAPFTWRFRVPKDRQVYLRDLILGEVTWSSADVGGDFVIFRSTGMPLYNFSVVVDDASMRITHVFRAQEHLMNTPKQLLLYEALGLPAPRFGHMPLILAPDRSKLSKRHGAVAVGDYQRQGYLPSSIVNYLAQLGWNDGTNKEIYSVKELLESFGMDRVSKVAAIFDKDKLKWVNAQHIKRLTEDEAFAKIGAELVFAGLVREASGEFVRQACALLQERISVLPEAGQQLREMMAYDLDAMLADERNKDHVDRGAVRETAAIILRAKADGDLDEVGRDKDVFKRLGDRVRAERGGGKKKAQRRELLAPLRLCLTSSSHGPDMARFFAMLRLADDNVLCEVVPLEARLEALRRKFKL